MHSRYPDIEFTLPFSPRDKRILSFIVRYIINKYNEQLAPFSLFNPQNQISKILIRHEPLPGDEKYLGYADFHKDEIVLHAKPDIGYFTASGHASTLSHEIAHHAIEEYFEGQNDAYRLGNNLVHKAENDNTYQSTARYFNPIFSFREKLVGFSVKIFDLRGLIDNRAFIMGNLNLYKGRHEFW